MRILLLGNGFDLYHKFPTRYDNFLHTVDFLLQHYDEKSMLTIGNIFGDKRLLESDRFIPECYDMHKEAYNEISVDQEKIKKIISIARDNIWFKYYLAAYNKELGWIDFEREISKVLQAFEEFFLCYDSVYDITFPKDKAYSFIIKSFDFFYKYTLSETGVSGGWFGGMKSNIVLCDYQLEEPYGSKIIIIDKSKIIDKLYDELLNLSEVLRLYLEVFVDNAIEAISRNQSLPKTSLFNNINEVITFNYTTTFEEVYKSNQTHHLHGKLTNSIILGVNPDYNDEADERNYINTDFLQFKKYYQRVLNGSDIGYLGVVKRITEDTAFLTNYHCKLYVVGHSLDVTDEDIIREIFSLASKIVIVCYNENAIASSINNIIKIYGKKEFDSIRLRTDMEFKLYSDFEQ